MPWTKNDIPRVTLDVEAAKRPGVS